MQTYVFVEGPTASKKFDSKELEARRKHREILEQQHRSEHLSELLDSIRYCFNMPASVYFRKNQANLCESAGTTRGCLDFDDIIDHWHSTPKIKRHACERSQLTKGVYAYHVYTMRDLYALFVKFDDTNNKFKFRDFENALRKCILKKDPFELEMFRYPMLCRDGYIIVAVYIDRDGSNKLDYDGLCLENEVLAETTVEDTVTETVHTAEDGTTETTVEETHTETTVE